MIEISFIVRHPFTVSGYMSGAVMIVSKIYRSSGSVLMIIFERGIEQHQQSFHWTQIMMIIFIQEVLQSQIMNLVLIILWGSYLHNQRGALLDQLIFVMNMSLL